MRNPSLTQVRSCDTLLKRGPGAPTGNWNALKHGKRSKRLKAERMAQRQAGAAEERRKFEAWSAPILQRCREQHRAVMQQIEAERAIAARLTEDH